MAIYTQYENAPKLTSLIDKLTDFLTINILDYYKDFYNLFTCNTNGLDNWGRILNRSRVVPLINFENIFGFDDGTIPVPLDSGYPQNLFYSNFFDPTPGQQTLNDNAYRALLWLTYLSYVISPTVSGCMYVANSYVQSKNIDYRCDIQEYLGEQTFDYIFNFKLEPFEITLFRFLKVLPTPAGITYGVRWSE